MLKKAKKTTKKSATTQLDQQDIASECLFLVSRRKGSDIGINDDDYDPDVEHLLSYPNNPETKKKYVYTKNSSKAFCNKQGIKDDYNKPKQ
eukprot:2284365-Ditylum_brightwellii.AAC.1